MAAGTTGGTTRSAGTPPAPAGGVPATAGGSLEQAYAAVMARGPLWHRMKFNGQTREYTFEMSVPSRLNTAVQRTVEASALAPADAIRRALEQLGAES